MANANDTKNSLSRRSFNFVSLVAAVIRFCELVIGDIHQAANCVHCATATCIIYGMNFSISVRNESGVFAEFLSARRIVAFQTIDEKKNSATTISPQPLFECKEKHPVVRFVVRFLSLFFV